MKNALFLNGKLSHVVEFLRRYGDTYCLHLQDKITEPTSRKQVCKTAPYETL